MERITDLEAAQRIDQRGLYAPLREHRNAVQTWPLLRGEKPLPAGCDQQGRYATRRVDTAGMSPSECCTEIGADDPMAPETFRMLLTVILPVSACVSLGALWWLAQWMGWLS